MTTASARPEQPGRAVEDAARRALSAVGIEAGDAVCDLLAGGLMNHTVRVRARAGDFCVRLRPDSLGASSQLFAAERWALPLAARAGLGHARLLGRLRVAGGWSAAVFETVDAPRLDHVLAAADADGADAGGGPDIGAATAVRSGAEMGAGTARIAALGRAWGRDLARLHALPCAGFGPLLEGGCEDARAFLGPLFMAECAPLAAVDPALAARYAARVSATLERPEIGRRRPSYVHGDVHARNILVRDGTLVWLDWEACRRRLPEFDFAQLPFTNWRGRPALRDAMVAGYAAEEGAGLDPLLLQLAQIYWHVRFGLFLKTCALPVDAAYFGGAAAHMAEAGALLARPPADWMLRLGRAGGAG